MSNVTYLPDPMQRQWQVFEAAIRQEIIDTGVAPDIAETALVAIKPVYLKHARTEPCVIAKDDVETALMEIGKWVTKLCSNLLGEVIIREIELIGYRANQKGDRK